MTATVHRLFGAASEPRRNARSTANSGDPALSLPANPLIDALRSATAPVLLAHLRNLFEGADDALFQMSERAGSEADRKLHFSTMRLLRLERPRMESEFERSYAISFLPAGSRGTQGADDELDLDRFSVQATEELEERIALGNLTTKAETLHREPLREIARRVEVLIRDLGVPIAPTAFAPEAICGAFRDSTAGLDLELPVRLLLFKLFDRFVVSQLGMVYQSALQVLDRQGIFAAPVAAAAPAATGSYNAPPPAPVFDEPLVHPGVDAETRLALENLAQSLKTYRPLDAQFAAELAACAVPVPGAPLSARTVAVAQCLSLVGQMCNEILADPHLPPPMRPLFERLRFPLIKIALADGSFFANRGHPVRRLLAEAAETAQTSRTSSAAVARGQEERLRHIAEQIDLSAAFVRPQVDSLSPLPTPAITQFLDQQRVEAEARRETVLNKVRRAVAQELEVHTLGRNLPASLTQFLRAGWGPLMAARLLRHGMSSRMWIDAVNRLVQILSSTDILLVTPDVLAVRRELTDAVVADLGEIGMRDERRDAVVEQLRRAYAELDERVSRMTPAERAKAEFESLSPAEHSALLAEFPVPGSARAPASPPPRTEPLGEVRLVSHLLERDRLPVPAPPSATVVAPPGVKAPAAPVIGTPPLQPPVVPPPPPPQDVVVTPAVPREPAPVVIHPMPPMPPVPPPPAPVEAAVPPPPASDEVADLLARCLIAESWFRVFDGDSGQTLWLKVSRYYREHDSVGFTGFDAKKTLSIRASRVLEDLVAGRTEPVNPSPAQARALADLRAHRRP